MDAMLCRIHHRYNTWRLPEQLHGSGADTKGLTSCGVKVVERQRKG